MAAVEYLEITQSSSRMKKMSVLAVVEVEVFVRTEMERKS